jgi:PPOX class probable F420-dependent enzyme
MGTPLDSAQYVNLETFRKDGTGVKTPMWAAPLDGKLVMGTNGVSYKAKRIRKSGRVRVAACNANGQQILGPWYDGQARVLEGAEGDPGEAALDAKYGILRRTMRFFSKLVGRSRVIIVIEVGQQVPSQ